MAEALKDQMFQKSFYENLCDKIMEKYSAFDKNKFFKILYDHEWDDKALKERMSHSSRVLQQTLPEDYFKALDILQSIAHHFNGFDAMIFPDFVEQFGQDHYEVSVSALELFTQYSSAEFAIRPFIVQRPGETMKRMLAWSMHENHHVRRLSSEGCRPRLPWAMALPEFKKDPKLILPILENLKSDPSEYVRKSVANNLNDITKDNPDIVLEMLNDWNKKPSKETKWIIKHALRGLLKAGNEKALSILGYNSTDVKIKDLKVSPKKIKLGEQIDISFEVTNQSTEKQSLMIDYIIHFTKANGKTAPKVFKLNTTTLEPKGNTQINKTHPIKEITTRKYYSGENFVEIQVNGKVLGKSNFELVVK
ncbi:DNA alkylation repair protein [Fulvivirgaceae bacterium BMA10]|uniref:DNA alkylation repair protein n=1 Tax=Splendidivirga corallicola TaxID=3051826 RepID=A0ABT8KMD7_9BACT|nr:DNA alkylation repair protein [Fulvivirgaceae bacterium BMA10]